MLRPFPQIPLDAEELEAQAAAEARGLMPGTQSSQGTPGTQLQAVLAGLQVCKGAKSVGQGAGGSVSLRGKVGPRM